MREIGKSVSIRIQNDMDHLLNLVQLFERNRSFQRRYDMSELMIEKLDNPHWLLDKLTF